MTTLCLVRHGETVDNARQLMQGQTQGQLNAKGFEQAEALAQRLASEPVDAFVASDLHRAIQTAEVLARPHGKLVVTTPLLRERDWGDFTGRYIPELKGEVWPDNVESIEDLQARARRFLDWVRACFPDQFVVAVGHGIVNKAIQAVHFRKEMREVERMMNCDVRMLEL